LCGDLIEGRRLCHLDVKLLEIFSPAVGRVMTEVREADQSHSREIIAIPAATGVVIYAVGLFWYEIYEVQLIWHRLSHLVAAPRSPR